MAAWSNFQNWGQNKFSEMMGINGVGRTTEDTIDADRVNKFEIY